MRLKPLISILLLSALVSCASMTAKQEKEMAGWEAQKLDVKAKSPVKAAFLNILPGCGDFYNGHVAYGLGSVMTWPLSMLWAPFGGASGAKLANYYATRDYVNELEFNKETLKYDLETALLAGQLQKEEFAEALKKVDAMEITAFKNKIAVEEFLSREQLAVERIPSGKK